jgi:hypothetical protein
VLHPKCISSRNMFLDAETRFRISNPQTHLGTMRNRASHPAPRDALAFCENCARKVRGNCEESARSARGVRGKCEAVFSLRIKLPAGSGMRVDSTTLSTTPLPPSSKASSAAATAGCSSSGIHPSATAASLAVAELLLLARLVGLIAACWPLVAAAEAGGSGASRVIDPRGCAVGPVEVGVDEVRKRVRAKCEGGARELRGSARGCEGVQEFLREVRGECEESARGPESCENLPSERPGSSTLH